MCGEIRKIFKINKNMFNEEKVEKAIKMLLEGFGEDLNREGLKETPKRVAKYWKQVLGGYDEDPNQHLKIFNEDAKDMVVVEAPIYSYL